MTREKLIAIFLNVLKKEIPEDDRVNSLFSVFGACFNELSFVLLIGCYFRY
ncbi:MAG TPA: hypothetical protein VF088_06915 [Pyrinomonadaceae bacterium]